MGAPQTQDLLQLPPNLTGDALIREVNRRLRTIAVQLARLQASPVNDLAGQRLTNVGRAQVDSDAVTRKDLQDYSAFAPDGDDAIATRPLVAQGGLRVPKHAQNKDEVVTLEDLERFTTTMVEETAVMIGSTAAGGDLAGTYPNPTVAFVFEEFPGPAASVTLSSTPHVLWVFKDGVWQRPVGGAPAEGEYKRVGAVLTITVAAASIVNVIHLP